MKHLSRDDLTLRAAHGYVLARHADLHRDVHPDLLVQFEQLSPAALAALQDVRRQYTEQYEEILMTPNASGFVDTYGRVRVAPCGTLPEDVVRGGDRMTRPLPIPIIRTIPEGSPTNNDNEENT